MSEIRPLAFQWDGEAMVPRHPALADRQYVVGEIYTLAPHEQRSPASHRHYFVLVKEAHDNLPPIVAERLPTPEHLRKYALIKAGYRDERSFTCSSRAEAIRMAAFLRPIDDYAVVEVSGSVVTVYTAKSQDLRSMPRKVFQVSKDAVLRVISDLIGVDVSELKRAEAA